MTGKTSIVITYRKIFYFCAILHPDIGAGRIFADYYQDRLRYVPERKVWFYYQDGIWQPDTGSLRAMKYCMELADLMYTFALEIRDEDKRKAYMKYASRWQEQKDLESRVTALREVISKAKLHRLNIDSFLTQVRKYTEVKELDAEIIRTLVERIDVFTPEKVPGSKTKK